MISLSFCCVIETAEESYKFVEKSKRVRIPKILDPIPAEEETVTPIEKERKEVKDKMINHLMGLD